MFHTVFNLQFQFRIQKFLVIFMQYVTYLLLKTKRGLMDLTPKPLCPPNQLDQQKANNTNEDMFQYLDIDNGLQINLQYERLKILTNIFSFLLAIQCMMIFFYVELNYVNIENAGLLLIFCQILHIVSEIQLILITVIQYQYFQHKQKQEYNFIASIIKIILFLFIFPFHFYQRKVQIFWSNNSVFQSGYYLNFNYFMIIIVWFKNSVIVSKNVLVNTIYFRPRCLRINKMYQVNVTNGLNAFKCCYRRYSVQILSFLFVYGIILFSLSIRIVERQVDIQNNPFYYYQNCLWYTMITITTIGLGDIRVVTQAGYILSVLTMVLGTFLISSILVVIINTIKMTHQQSQALMTYKKVEHLLDFKKLCGIYIRESVWRLWKNHKAKKRFKEGQIQRNLRRRLTKIRRQFSSLQTKEHLADIAMQQFDKTSLLVHDLQENNLNLLDFISHHLFLNGEDEQLSYLFSDKQNKIRSSMKNINLGNPRKQMSLSKQQIGQPIFQVDQQIQKNMISVDQIDNQSHKNSKNYTIQIKSRQEY